MIEIILIFLFVFICGKHYKDMIEIIEDLCHHHTKKDDDQNDYDEN